MSTPAHMTWEERHGRWRAVVAAVVDGASVLASALRLLLRHGPALLTLFLAGMLARELVMRAAVRASAVNAELGMLVLLLAPMATLTAIVLMLRVVRPSLPWLSTDPHGPPPSMLAHLASVLLPFIAVYEFEGGLRADVLEYNGRVLDDILEQVFDDPDRITDRVPYDLSVTVAVLIAVVIVARWLLSRLTDRSPKLNWLGLVGAYLELVWLVLATVIAFGSLRDWVLSWTGERRMGQALIRGWEQLTGDPSGPLGAWFAEQLGRVDTVLVIPAIWLAVGMVVVGARESEPDLPDAAAGSAVYERTRARWLALPRPLRWVVDNITADLRYRFAPLMWSLRLLWRTGLVPLLLFCLAFVAARTLADWLWQLQRLLIGPQDFEGVWQPISWPLQVLNEAAGTVVLVCLLAAAVDRAVRGSAQPEPDVGRQRLGDGQP